LVCRIQIRVPTYNQKVFWIITIAVWILRCGFFCTKRSEFYETTVPSGTPSLIPKNWVKRYDCLSVNPNPVHYICNLKVRMRHRSYGVKLDYFFDSKNCICNKSSIHLLCTCGMLETFHLSICNLLRKNLILANY